MLPFYLFLWAQSAKLQSLNLEVKGLWEEQLQQENKCWPVAQPEKGMAALHGHDGQGEGGERENGRRSRS